MITNLYLIFIYWSCILWSCWIPLLILVLFWGRFLGIFNKVNIIWQYKQVYLFLIFMTFISFSCLIALARTPVWCWSDMMVRLDTLALFLSLGKNYAVPLMVGFSSLLFIRLRKFAFISGFWRVFITNVGVC